MLDNVVMENRLFSTFLIRQVRIEQRTKGVVILSLLEATAHMGCGVEATNNQYSCESAKVTADLNLDSG